MDSGGEGWYGRIGSGFLRVGTGIIIGGVAVPVVAAEERMLGCIATEMMGALAFGIGGTAIKVGGPERFRAVGGGATTGGLGFAAGLRTPYLDWSLVSSLV